MFQCFLQEWGGEGQLIVESINFGRIKCRFYKHMLAEIYNHNQKWANPQLQSKVYILSVYNLQSKSC